MNRRAIPGRHGRCASTRRSYRVFLRRNNLAESMSAQETAHAWDGFIILVHDICGKVRTSLDQHAGAWPAVDGPFALADWARDGDSSSPGYRTAGRAGGAVRA